MRRVETDMICPKCKKTYLYRCTAKAYDGGENPFQDKWYECDECGEMFEVEEIEEAKNEDD